MLPHLQLKLPPRKHLLWDSGRAVPKCLTMYLYSAYPSPRSWHSLNFNVLLMTGYYLNTRSVGVKILSLGQPVVQSENTHTCMDEDHDMLGFIPAPIILPSQILCRLYKAFKIKGPSNEY